MIQHQLSASKHDGTGQSGVVSLIHRAVFPSERSPSSNPTPPVQENYLYQFIEVLFFKLEVGKDNGKRPYHTPREFMSYTNKSRLGDVG